MPAYDYRCRTCATSFEVTRSITEPETESPACPEGHRETSRVFTAVAVGRAAGGTAVAPAPAPAGGGCCGGGCCG